jgi:hypothetical protein
MMSQQTQKTVETAKSWIKTIGERNAPYPEDLSGPRLG